jgi:hypothetical protein
VSLEERGTNKFLGPTTVLDEVGNEVAPANCALKPEESSGRLHAPRTRDTSRLSKVLHEEVETMAETASHDPFGLLVLESNHSTPVCLSTVKHPTT